jgi:endoglucanase
VFGWPAIHTRKGEKKKKLLKLVICSSTGCETKEEVDKMGVHVGCVITYPDEF